MSTTRVVVPIEIPARDVPDSPFVTGRAERPLSLDVVLDTSLHGPWITELRGSADVVLATTWEHAANGYVATLLGIDPLPVGISIEQDPPRYSVARDRHRAQ